MRQCLLYDLLLTEELVGVNGEMPFLHVASTA